MISFANMPDILVPGDFLRLFGAPASSLPRWLDRCPDLAAFQTIGGNTRFRTSTVFKEYWLPPSLRGDDPETSEQRELYAKLFIEVYNGTWRMLPPVVMWRLFGRNEKTIRRWEHTNVIPAPIKTPGGRRVYIEALYYDVWVTCQTVTGTHTLADYREAVTQAIEGVDKRPSRHSTKDHLPPTLNPLQVSILYGVDRRTVSAWLNNSRFGSLPVPVKYGQRRRFVLPTEAVFATYWLPVTLRVDTPELEEQRAVYRQLFIDVLHGRVGFLTTAMMGTLLGGVTPQTIFNRVETGIIPPPIITLGGNHQFPIPLYYESWSSTIKDAEPPSRERYTAAVEKAIREHTAR